MKKEDTEMMLRIFETERAGYAYLYPSDGGERKEDYISTTAENIANYIGSHMFEAEKIVITDMCDRLILDTCGYFINSCPNQEFCKEIHPFLIPIQMGEKDAGEVLSVSRDVAEQYFREEDEAASGVYQWEPCHSRIQGLGGRADGRNSKKDQHDTCQGTV